MLRILLPCAVFVTLPLAAGDVSPHIEKREFAGGTIRVAVRDGGLKIVHGADNQHIVVRYTASERDLDASNRVKLSFSSQGSDVLIDLRVPRNVRLETVVEVPSPVSLEVKMRDGDVLVEGVEGSKTLRARSGGITLAQPKAEYTQAYKQIDVSARIGNVYGPSFQTLHGRLGKTGELNGTGTYSLHAHVTFGDIQLLPSL